MIGSTGSSKKVNLLKLSDLGNTTTKSRDSPKKHFLLTINNYTEEDKEILSGSNKIDICVAQAEVGEQGTKHLQVYIKTVDKLRFNSIKELFPRAHIEKVKNIEKTIEYCQKEDTKDKENPWELFRGINKKIKLKKITWEMLKEHQCKVVKEILNYDGEYRKVLWYDDEVGGFGKSLIAKYLYDNYNCIVLNGGKSNDINFVVKGMIDIDKQIDIIVFDIPRCSIDYINYSAIECLYNGLITCNKYESCILRFNPPKCIVVFANEVPDAEKWSRDRVDLRCIRKPGTGGSR